MDGSTWPLVYHTSLLRSHTEDTQKGQTSTYFVSMSSASTESAFLGQFYPDKSLGHLLSHILALSCQSQSCPGITTSTEAHINTDILSWKMYTGFWVYNLNALFVQKFRSYWKCQSPGFTRKSHRKPKNAGAQSQRIMMDKGTNWLVPNSFAVLTQVSRF